MLPHQDFFLDLDLQSITLSDNDDILGEVVGAEGMTAQSKHVAFGDSMPGVKQADAEARR